MEENAPEPSSRERLNRYVGLFFYAAGVVLLGLLLVGLVAEGAQGEWDAIGVLAAMSLICLAIGYTTGRKRIS
jgi:hypothetical protein